MAKNLKTVYSVSLLVIMAVSRLNYLSCASMCNYAPTSTHTDEESKNSMKTETKC